MLLYIKTIWQILMTICIWQFIISSIVNEVIKTISRQFFFLRKDFEHTKSIKTQNKQLPPLLCAKNYCLCCFLFTCFFGFFCWLVLSCFAFLNAQHLFVKKKNWLEIVLITSFTMLVTCTPINLPIDSLFVHTYFYMWSFARVSSFYENLFYLWESLLIVRISVICVNLCLYENKHAYESHHLKQIFYHQNMIMIFCWFRMFQSHVFCFGFFSFCVWLFSC